MTDPHIPTLYNLGSGPRGLLGSLTDATAFAGWREIRVDLDPANAPEILANLTDLSQSVADHSADIVYCSHVLEHFHDHELSPVLAEILRILRPDGAAVLRVPDLAAALRGLDENDLEKTLYPSPAGPIRLLDVIYGHRASIHEGNLFMAHHTGFTQSSLAGRLLEAGFEEVRTQPGTSFDFCAIATRQPAACQRQVDVLCALSIA